MNQQQTETVRGPDAKPPILSVQTPPGGPSASITAPPGSTIQAEGMDTKLTTELSWMGSVFSQKLLAWGTTGVVCLLLAIKIIHLDPQAHREDIEMRREDAKESAQLSRDAHEKVFERMRQDSKEANEHDRQQRIKMTTAIREQTKVMEEAAKSVGYQVRAVEHQTKVLEAMDRNQIKMINLLEKMKP